MCGGAWWGTGTLWWVVWMATGAKRFSWDDAAAAATALPSAVLSG